MHIWSVTCRSTIVDRTSNNLSLINGLEEIGIDPKQLPPLPKGKEGYLIPIDFDVVNLWYRQGAEKELLAEGRLVIEDPNEKELVAATMPIKFGEGKKRVRVKTNVKGLPVTIAGDYWVKIYEGQKEVARIPIEVKFTKKQ